MNEDYTLEGLEAMLSNYHRLEGNDYKIEVDRFLESNLVAEDMAVYISLHYSLELSDLQIVRLLDRKISLLTLKELREEVLECLEAFLRGFKTKKVKVFKEFNAPDLEGHLMLLRENIISPMYISHSVVREVNERLAKLGDDNSKILLEQEAGYFRPNNLDENYWDEKPLRIYKTNDFGHKTAYNDEFYKRDYNNNVSLTLDMTMTEEMNYGNTKASLPKNRGKDTNGNY